MLLVMNICFISNNKLALLAITTHYNKPFAITNSYYGSFQKENIFLNINKKNILDFSNTEKENLHETKEQFRRLK